MIIPSPFLLPHYYYINPPVEVLVGAVIFGREREKRERERERERAPESEPYRRAFDITSEHFRVSALSGTVIREHNVLPQAVHCHKHSSDSRQPRKTSQRRRWYTTRSYARNPIFCVWGLYFYFVLYVRYMRPRFKLSL